MLNKHSKSIVASPGTTRSTSSDIFDGSFTLPFPSRSKSILERNCHRHETSCQRRRIGMSLFHLLALTTGAGVKSSGALPSSSSSSSSSNPFIEGETLPSASALSPPTSSRVRMIRDPNTYPALVYEPPMTSGQVLLKPPPLLLVLHGAAINQEQSVWKALGDPTGEHAGLPMQLLTSNVAPRELADNFCVAAPYSIGQPSFYQDSREKILSFVQYLANNNNQQDILPFDPTRIFLFGFSDGATVAVELATCRKFKAAVICSYGFSGPELPPMALQRLSGLGFWVFHAADDVIFDVGNSDRLVAALRETNGPVASERLVKYSRYASDPLLPLGMSVDKSTQGHTMGIVAAQTPELYKWLLSL